MKFVVSSSVLLKQLSAINGVVSTNPIVPILEDFLFSLDADSLTIQAADSDVLFYNGGSPARKTEPMPVMVTEIDTPLDDYFEEDDSSPNNTRHRRRQSINTPEHPLSFTPFQLDQLRQVLKPIVSEIVQHSLHPRPDLPERYLSGVSEVSKYFGIPEGTIRKHIKDIKHSKRGKRLYFTVQDVSDWIDQGRRATRIEVEEATQRHLNSLRRQ